MNNNALKYKKKNRNFIKNIIKHLKKQNNKSHSSFEFTKLSREEIFYKFLTCTTIENQIMLIKQLSDKTSKINCCNTMKLIKQKKLLKEIIVQNLNFNK